MRFLRRLASIAFLAFVAAAVRPGQAGSAGTTVGVPGDGGLTRVATPVASPTAAPGATPGARPEGACAEDVSPDLVAVAVPKRLDVAVGRAESFALTVRNLAPGAARVGLAARVFSAAQNTQTVISPVEVARGGSRVIRLTPAALGLAEKPLDWAGEIVVTPFVDRRKSRVEADLQLRLWFHPAAGKWRIYDDAVRRERHPDGAVSDAALAERKLPDPFAARGEIGERFGAVRVVKRADSTTKLVEREEDGAPDGEAK